MSDWAKQKLKQEHDRYIDGVIQLSQMLEDSKLSSTAAKTVFSEFYNAHKKNNHYIREIDRMFV